MKGSIFFNDINFHEDIIEINMCGLHNYNQVKFITLTMKCMITLTWWDC